MVPVATPRRLTAVLAVVLVVLVPATAGAAPLVEDWGTGGVVRLPRDAIESIEDVAASPDGSVVAVGTDADGAAGVVVSPDGTVLRPLAVPRGSGTVVHSDVVAHRGAILVAGAADLGASPQAVVDEYTPDGVFVARLLTVDIAPETVILSMAATGGAIHLAGLAYEGATELAWVGTWSRSGTERWTATWRVRDGELWQTEVLLSDGRPVAVVAVQGLDDLDVRFLSLGRSAPSQVASVRLELGSVDLQGAWWSGTAVASVGVGYIDTDVHLFPVLPSGAPGDSATARVVHDVDLALGRDRDGRPLVAYSAAGFEPVVIVERATDPATLFVLDESEIPQRVVAVVVAPDDGSVLLTLEEGLAPATTHTIRRIEGDGRGRFVDDDTSVHEADVEQLAARGWTLGCNPPFEDAFCPRRSLTRGEAAAFVRRALRLPPSGVDHFDDDDGSLFEDDIDALAAAGIVRGCDPPANRRSCPDDPVTRGQVAAILRRAAAVPPSDVDHFVDDDGSIFAADIDAIAAAGITRGCDPPTNDHFCPNRVTTRQQMASLLVRSFP